MAVRYSYTPTDVSNIAKTLGGVFAAMEQEGQVTRFATNNLVITACSQTALDEVEEFVDLLSVVHPSRFFIIQTSAAQAALTAEVSARCQMISKTEHVCSEVVRIHAHPRDVGAIRSILSANSITGVPTELFVFDPETPGELVEQLLPLSESLYFDSADFDKRSDVMSQIAAARATCVDLQWVNLAPWRDQIKDTFDYAAVRDLVPKLQRISIITSTELRGALPATTRLIAGWLIGRLGLEVRVGSKGLVGQRRDGSEIVFAFETSGESASSELREVCLDFSTGGKKSCVRFVKGAGLETRVELDRTWKHVSPFESQDKLSRMKRYFTIGESIANYPLALRRSLVLDRLSQNLR